MTKLERIILLKNLTSINNNAFFASYSSDKKEMQDCMVKIFESVSNLLKIIK